MQMNEATIYILLAILSLIIGYFINENKQLKKKILDSEARIQQLSGATEDARVMAAAMEATQRSLEEQLQQEKDSHAEKQQELKEQLELMGKDLVRQGASVLKSENEEKLNAILEPLKERINAFEKEVREANRLGTERHVSMEAVIKTLSEQHSKMNTTSWMPCVESKKYRETGVSSPWNVSWKPADWKRTGSILCKIVSKMPKETTCVPM